MIGELGGGAGVGGGFGIPEVRVVGPTLLPTGGSGPCTLVGP
jgi:hypothetical protein